MRCNHRNSKSILVCINRSSVLKTCGVTVPLYLALVRLQLDYCMQFWAPNFKTDIEKLESTPIWVTKIIKVLEYKLHKQQCKDMPHAKWRWWVSVATTFAKQMTTCSSCFLSPHLQVSAQDSCSNCPQLCSYTTVHKERLKEPNVLSAKKERWGIVIAV